MNIITEEQISEALKSAGFAVLSDDIYEITTRGFGTRLDLPNFRAKILHHRVEGETKVSYVSHGIKINKKTLQYTDRYSGCVEKCCWGKDLVKEIWMDCNRYQIIENLRFNNDYELYKKLAEVLLKEN